MRKHKPNQAVITDARQLAFVALRSVYQGAFTDVVLDRLFNQADLNIQERRLATELVYGGVRRRRTLDALIDQLGKKRAHQQPSDLRIILHIGLYQLRYLDQIPASAAVDTSVKLAKKNGFYPLAGVVNGLLRQYSRLTEHSEPDAGGMANDLPASGDPLILPTDPVARLGVRHSYPDWIVQIWQDALGAEETEQLCQWFNQPPKIDLRVNALQSSLDEVQEAFQAAGIAVSRMPNLLQALRLDHPVGAIPALPGYEQGWWSVQDSSAQWVGYLMDPQPGETIIDACAAPGGKTTHLAELMRDRGTIWACDRTPSRLKKLTQNARRLQLTCIQTCVGDSRELSQFEQQADRVLVDAPCSGLGTLHRHADARWRQTPETVRDLSQLQKELLHQTAAWVKPGGCLFYATCTLHPAENEAVIQDFLTHHPTWRIDPPSDESPMTKFTHPEGWLKVWPHRHQMDGFFMVRLRAPNRSDIPG
ncbi:MAG: 16S rRNA (cytosine(967)-C(5))-methyltransferase [Leptolyngbyaceae cyanobacterium MO_188.B28]|nr:16S rRNA (cytosine(967)-C(5))-methyltransferase [Leptolyngbyaceae cyanobacterium MO_188.B28]